MGNPIGHSLSPMIHSLFAEQTGQSLHYQSILVDIGGFSQALEKFRKLGGKGLSVTIPFKLDAFECSEELSDRARQAEAVNTIWFDENDKILGDNTDGIGLVNDIVKNHQFNLQGCRLLILGAGGAVQGILGPLIEQGPSKITIANRTISKAERLRDIFSGFPSMITCGYDGLDQEAYDVVINGTSSSLDQQLPPVSGTIFHKDTLSYDLMYSKSGTVFQQWSREQGAAICLDGLGMLVEQAAAAFEIWRGVRPDTGTVINILSSR